MVLGQEPRADQTGKEKTVTSHVVLFLAGLTLGAFLTASILVVMWMSGLR